MRKVYGILGLQLILTTVVAAVIAVQPLSWILTNRWLMTLGMVGSFGTLLPLVCIPSLGRRSPWNLGLLA